MNKFDKYTIKDTTKCKLCFDTFEHLGSHIWHGHHMTTRAYKQQFELDYKMPLISEAVYNKKVIAFNKNRKKYLANITGEVSKKYQFKPGHDGNIRRSKQTLIRAGENGLKALETEKGLCPICRMGFDHVDSHLYNKHGLKRA